MRCEIIERMPSGGQVTVARSSDFDYASKLRNQEAARIAAIRHRPVLLELWVSGLPDADGPVLVNSVSASLTLTFIDPPES